MKALREYQQKIVDAVLNSNKNQIVCAPTGSGKTVMASSIINNIAEKNNTVVFVVPRLELINQATSEFGDVDYIWANKTELTGKNKIIASKDSLKTQWQKIKDIPNLVLIFDECHVGIQSTHTLVEKLNPKRILGLTATPERMDGLALLKGKCKRHKFGVFDEVVQIESVASLISKGYLAPLRYFTKPIMGITDIKPQVGGDSKELSGEQMTRLFDEHEIWGNIVESYKKYAIDDYGNKRPAIGFTTTIAMGERVVRLFKDSGYKFEIIHGGMDIETRNMLLGKLRSKELDGLVNAELLTYGFDCPPVSYAFSCRHIKSRPLWFQIVGRILRTSAETGKTDAIFMDHGDSISEFSEKDCALPILSRHLNWRSDGEDIEEKKSRTKQMKKTQNILRELQELDPIPCELVEITTEDNFDRLLRVLRDTREKKEKLEQENNKLAQSNEQLKTALSAAQKGQIEKHVDIAATDKYIKDNYRRTRLMLENRDASLIDNRDKAHAMTRSFIIKNSERQPFILDSVSMERQFSWWEKRYDRNFNIDEWKKTKLQNNQVTTEPTLAFGGRGQ